jgi:transposase InsO family protein
VLAAHRGKSQGRPRTTSSSQLISQNGLPVRVSQQRPKSPEPEDSRQRRTAVSSPDNGSAYISAAHRIACQQLGLRHLRTKPYRPRTNGKAERLIQTMLRRWAYARAYSSSAERTAALGAWLHHYNFIRPHGSLSHKPPGSRLTKAPGNDT